jgi:hypothetical protein
MWYLERKQKYKATSTPLIQLCFGNGKVQLALLRHNRLRNKKLNSAESQIKVEIALNH